MPSLSDQRAFAWLQRAQALAGTCGEGDSAAFDLWRRHWRDRGDSAREAAADEARRRALAFSMADALAHVDLASYAFVVTTLVFWITLGALAAGRGRGNRAIAGLGPVPRRLVLSAWAACLVSGAWLGEAGGRLVHWAEFDIGHADATGSAFITERLEARVARHDVPRTRWVAAVANHLAGNRDRAAELYRALPGDSRAEQNLEALEKGLLAPPVSLTGDDLVAAYAAEPWLSRLGWLGVPGRVFRALPHGLDLASPAAWLTALAGLLLAVAFARARPSAAVATSPPGRLARLAGRLVPGVADFHRGHVFRGYATLVLFLFPALALAMQVVSLAGAPGIGPLTSFHSFQVLKAYVIPSSFLRADGTASTAARWWVLLSHPHAAAFLVLAAAAAVASVALHVRGRER